MHNAGVLGKLASWASGWIGAGAGRLRSLANRLCASGPTTAIHPTHGGLPTTVLRSSSECSWNKRRFSFSVGALAGLYFGKLGDHLLLSIYHPNEHQNQREKRTSFVLQCLSKNNLLSKLQILREGRFFMRDIHESRENLYLCSSLNNILRQSSFFVAIFNYFCDGNALPQK